MLVNEALQHLKPYLINCEVNLDTFFKEPFNFSFSDNLYFIVSSADWVNLCGNSYFQKNFDPYTNYKTVSSGNLGVYQHSRSIKFFSEVYKKGEKIELKNSIIYNATLKVSYEVKINFE